MLKIIEKTKIWFTISIIIVIVGVVMIGVKGLNYGIDFKGGTVVEINMEKDFNKDDVQTIVHKYDKDATTKTIDAKSIEISSRHLQSEDISKMFKEIKNQYKLEANNPTKQDTIGPSIGQELKYKAVVSIVIAIILILIYLGIRFELNYGIAAIIALVHDVFITLTVYVVLQIPVNTSFIAAILTITGYSLCDTIVVFDRIRENTNKFRKLPYSELANKSITETLARSIKTIVTVLITIASMHYFVPAVREFTLPLLLGIVSGAYSSIFIASPFWVIFKNLKAKKKALN